VPATPTPTTPTPPTPEPTFEPTPEPETPTPPTPIPHNHQETPEPPTTPEPTTPSVCSATTQGWLIGYPGTVESDTDGQGIVDYLNNEHCAWRIQCPQGYEVELSISGVLGSGDTLELESTTQNSIFSLSQGTLNVPTTMVGYSSVNVEFDSDAAGTANGFTINFTCHVGDDEGTCEPASTSL
jgi:hypothetical protein